jgi:hypothetical protein
VKQLDPLLGARICKKFGDNWYHGRVMEVEASEKTGEFAYCIGYDDGDSEHMTEQTVRAHLWRQSKGPIRRSFAPTPPPRSPLGGAMGYAGYRDRSPAPIAQSTTPWVVYIAAALIVLLVASWFWDYKFSPVEGTTHHDSSGSVSYSDFLDFPGINQAPDIASKLRFPVPEVASSTTQTPHSDIGDRSRLSDFAARLVSFEKPPDTEKAKPPESVMPFSTTQAPVTSLFFPSQPYASVDNTGMSRESSNTGGGDSGQSSGVEEDDLDLGSTIIVLVIAMGSVCAICWVPLSRARSVQGQHGGADLAQHAVDAMQPSTGGLAQDASARCGGAASSDRMAEAAPQTPLRSQASSAPQMPFQYPSPIAEIPVMSSPAAQPKSKVDGSQSFPSSVPTPVRAAAASASDPVRSSPGQFRHSQALAHMISLGIPDSQHLRELLNYCNGSVPDAISELFAR